ncbi:Dol-P-Glc:Glc(2)Man(9)GlcNAc(2)-PP-Dol alpha-1,2-glucosyltransferase [Caenorhabditis elegans]|uniref:Dol-P-Glc:Glc(2)Man(9)GlcNAc(2)-PP-Dol alpha-1,2-glucosyltransferase n=1 Tax=Caenorhabditis elegans TaxID=6239 RepID=O02332_CAEEL|nr:Dol-P-Glc:Glc(2)Man(9)GlcNAc(2)-PP-Dol alpha-1,2-glucosyltransferase [Caenorhabditis elegans]CAB03424.2 Dol-P-Glc:Glc(2)Man(9)GlcNAc(2)-PP-Dol alpha-1,2-glucosyltransferase [Caenorhabditis elegans]|eukprot:NP_492634.2 Dol-P-Glc:Glc(2)Man(9)GlcNAc(2)-PP-Dol alpha-1,2-glucosyltransferase [Caenorhabditis elegans]
MTKSKPPRISLPFAAISRKSDFLLGASFSCIHVLLTTIVYHYVPEPYMDEIFHITQTRSYCSGNYSWNPLITTPPALYVISMPLCGGNERYANSILLFFAIPAFCRFRRMFVRQDVWLTASIVGMLPILISSSILFYTDLLSLTSVIWGFSIGNPIASAFLFLISILTRQTNIIWAAIYAFSVIASRIDKSRSKMENLKIIISTAFSLWPFITLAIGFAMFIYFNDFQIVLGDAKAHQPKFHVAQFFYMVAFCAAHTWTQIIPNLLSHLRHLTDMKSLVLQAVVAVLVYYYSYDHPYLLADNRHFTFYIWRRFLANPTMRTTLAPLYVFSLRFMTTSTPSVHIFHKILFIIASLLVLVPAHLFEMRYYIIPYVLWRLSTVNNSRKSLLFLEIISQAVIFAAVFVLFLFKTFEWSNEPGVKQRFMF